MLLVKKSQPVILAGLLVLFAGPSYAENIGTVTQEAGAYMSDSAITAEIKLKYTEDATLNPFDISVTTTDGNVVLSGKVNTDQEYSRAVSIAESANDVKNVVATGLNVKDSKSPIEDTFTTAKVKGVLIKNNLSSLDNAKDALNLGVETKDGVVYLTGTVDSEAQIQEIEKLVKSVDGVKSIESNLKVTGN